MIGETQVHGMTNQTKQGEEHDQIRNNRNRNRGKTRNRTVQNPDSITNMTEYLFTIGVLLQNIMTVAFLTMHGITILSATLTHQ